jgi:hypothetical protein
MDSVEARRLAETVADRLMVNAFGERGVRLMIVGREVGRYCVDFGGWCHGAIADQVESVLLAAPAADGAVPGEVEVLREAIPALEDLLLSWDEGRAPFGGESGRLRQRMVNTLDDIRAALAGKEPRG